jgi:hypothetical protein
MHVALGHSVDLVESVKGEVNRKGVKFVVELIWLDVEGLGRWTRGGVL